MIRIGLRRNCDPCTCDDFISLISISVLYTFFLEHCSYESWKKVKWILYSSTLRFGNGNIFSLKNDSFTKRLSVNMEKTNTVRNLAEEGRVDIWS